MASKGCPAGQGASISRDGLLAVPGVIRLVPQIYQDAAGHLPHRKLYLMVFIGCLAANLNLPFLLLRISYA
jgi:hypothetical protein